MGSFQETLKKIEQARAEKHSKNIQQAQASPTKNIPTQTTKSTSSSSSSKKKTSSSSFVQPFDVQVSAYKVQQEEKQVQEQLQTLQKQEQKIQSLQVSRPSDPTYSQLNKEIEQYNKEVKNLETKDKAYRQSYSQYDATYKQFEKEASYQPPTKTKAVPTIQGFTNLFIEPVEQRQQRLSESQQKQQRESEFQQFQKSEPFRTSQLSLQQQKDYGIISNREFKKQIQAEQRTERQLSRSFFYAEKQAEAKAKSEKISSFADKIISTKNLEKEKGIIPQAGLGIITGVKSATFGIPIIYQEAKSAYFGVASAVQSYGYGSDKKEIKSQFFKEGPKEAIKQPFDWAFEKKEINPRNSLSPVADSIAKASGLKYKYTPKVSALSETLLFAGASTLFGKKSKTRTETILDTGQTVKNPSYPFIYDIPTTKPTTTTTTFKQTYTDIKVIKDPITGKRTFEGFGETTKTRQPLTFEQVSKVTRGKKAQVRSPFSLFEQRTTRQLQRSKINKDLQRIKPKQEVSKIKITDKKVLYIPKPKIIDLPTIRKTRSIDITKPRPIDPLKPRPIEPVKPRPIDPLKPRPIDPLKPRPIDPLKPRPIEPKPKQYITRKIKDPIIPPPRRPFPFGFPKIDLDLGGGGGGGIFGSRDKRVSGRQTKYTPSIVASTFGIYGTAPTGQLTGLEFRPLIDEDKKKGKRKKRIY